MEVRKTLFVFRLFCKCDLVMRKNIKSKGSHEKKKTKKTKDVKKMVILFIYLFTGFLENQMGSLEASVVHEIHRYRSYAFCCVL